MDMSIRAVALASFIALAVAACGSVGSTPPQTAPPSPSASPTLTPPPPSPSSTPTIATPPPTPRPTVAPTPKATSTPSTTGDTGRAVKLLDGYEKALVAGDWQAAWRLLAPAYQASRGSLSAYADERKVYFASAGTSYMIGKPANDRASFRQWLPPAPGSLGADLAHAYVVQVTYPALTGNNAGIEVFLVGPTVAGVWAIWGLR